MQTDFICFRKKANIITRQTFTNKLLNRFDVIDKTFEFD